MAFESNDLKGILIMVLFAIPMIPSTNINCSGKAFHCVNSTHFMICVDMGGGMSTTIDDFVIPCPATTVCHENNVYECDFPEITKPQIQAIGVYKQSDTSEPTLVSNSATALTPSSEIFSVFKENMTATTLSIPEHVIPVAKLEVLENIKNPVGVNSDNTAETSFKVTSSFIDSKNEVVNDKQTSNNTITTSATDDNKLLEPVVEASIHKPVNTSSTDKSKSIDKVTSVIGLISLISTDLPNVVNTKPSSDVLTSLDTLYDNIDLTTEQYISDKSITAEIISTIPIANTIFQNILKNYVNNDSRSELNSTAEIPSMKKVPETNINYFIPEPITIGSLPAITVKTFVPITTEANIMFTTETALNSGILIKNDSLLEKHTNATQPLGIIITTDSPIEPTDNLYQINREMNQTMITVKNNTVSTITTTERVETVFDSSSTYMVNNQVTEPTLLPPTTMKNPAIELTTAETLQNGFTAHATEVKNELRATNALNEPYVENIKNPVGVNSDNTTETNFKVTSSFIDSTNEVINDKQTSNNTITTSATDNNKHLEPVVEISKYKPVNTSSTDKSKSIDTATSVIGLINLISTDLPSVVNTKPSSDVLTSLDTLYDNIVLTTEQYITKQVTIHGEKVENVTEKISIPKEIIFNERSVTTDAIEFINKKDLGNQTIAMGNYLGKTNNTSELEPETTTEYLAPIVHIFEPVTVDLSPLTKTDNTSVSLGLVDLISDDPKQNAPSTNEYINTFYGNTATMTTDQYTTKLETTSSDKPVTAEVISTIPITNMIFQNVLKNYVNNDSLTELNSTAEIPSMKKVQETNINYFLPEPTTIGSLPTITEKTFVPITTETNIIFTSETTLSSEVLKKNDSLLEKHRTATQPLGIIITTDSQIEPTDNLYQIHREINQTMIKAKNNTASTITTTERVETVFDASSTYMINNQVTEPTLLPPTTIKYSTIEISSTKTLQNAFTTHGIEAKNELAATNVPMSVNEPNLENIGTNALLSVQATPVPYNVTSASVTNITVKDFGSQSDIVINPQTGFTSEMIALKASDGFTSLDQATTQKVRTDPETKILGSVNQPENLVIVSIPEKLNANQLTKTVVDEDIVDVTTTYWKKFENSATTPFSSDVTVKTRLSDSVKSDNQDNTLTTNIVNTQDVLPETIPPLTEFTSTMLKTVHTASINVQSTKVFEQASTNTPELLNIYSVPTTDYNIETSIMYPVDVPHITKIKNETDTPVTILPPQEATSQKIGTVKQLNTSTTTETVSDFIPSTVATTGYVVFNTTYLNTSSWKDSVTIDTVISKVDPNADANKTETVNPMNDKNNINASLSVIYTNKDESIKIVSVSDIVNSSAQTKPNGTLQPTSSNSSLTSNDYIETTVSQGSRAYVTASDNVPDYKYLVQAGELVIQKNPEAIVSLAQTNVMNSILSTPSMYTLPITEINTGKDQYVDTEAPLHSTVELKQQNPTKQAVNYVTENTNDYISLTEAILTKLNKLPKVETESSVSSVSDFTPGALAPPELLKTVPVYDGVTIRDSAFIMSSTEMSPKVVTNNNIKIITESPLLTSQVMDTQTVKYKTESSLPISELPPVAQIITESTYTSDVFAQTTPFNKMNQDVLPGITIDLPQYGTSTLNKNIPQLMASLPIVRVIAAQITTEPTQTTNVFAQTTPLLATAGRTNLNQDVLPGIETTDLPQNVYSTVNKNIPQSMPLLPIVGLTAAQMTTEPTHTTNVFTQTTPLLAAVGKTNQDVPPGIKPTDFPQSMMSTVNNNISPSMESLPIAVVTATQITTEPNHITNVFSLTTPLLAASDKTNQDVPSGIKITDMPQYVMRTVTYNSTQWISDIPTETIPDSLTVPDSMVETIKLLGDKVSGIYLEDTTLSENNPTVNNANYSLKSVNNIIDHESIIVGTITKYNEQNMPITSAKSMDLNKEEIVNHTEGNLMRSAVNIDDVKIKESSIEEEDSKPLVLKSGTDVQNKTILSDSPITSKIEPKDGMPADKIVYRFTTVTTNYKEAESGDLKNGTKSKTITTKENKIAEIASTVNANIEIIDVKKYQFQVNSKDISDSYNINNTIANITTSQHNLSLQNSIINDELEQHLISTNHTITTEVQSHLNESDKQSNKTNDDLTLNGTSMHNPNLTSTKLNAGSNDTSAITVTALVFNCSNHTRGKYADKKDCRKFYTCIGTLIQPILGTCPNNTVFSEINKQCTRNLSHCVRNNQFRCLFEGRFSDFFKDNIYYICVKNRMNGFIRYKLQCQVDYHLNKDSVKCERNEEISTQSASSVSETNNDESKPKSENIVSTDDFECQNEGKFPYSKDCSKYHVCNEIKNVYYICVKNRTNGFIRYKLQCQADYHLNKSSVKCEKNEEISTQSASSISETNNDKSKPKPEKIDNKDDFQCDNEGTFPYAKDCSKYYVCTKIKNVYRRQIKKCASEEVFNKQKNKCVESDSGEC